MVGDNDSGEIFGMTMDGMYQIILRPGKWFFFQKKNFFGKFFSLSIFNMLNV